MFVMLEFYSSWHNTQGEWEQLLIGCYCEYVSLYSQQEDIVKISQFEFSFWHSWLVVTAGIVEWNRLQ